MKNIFPILVCMCACNQVTNDDVYKTKKNVMDSLEMAIQKLSVKQHEQDSILHEKIIELQEMDTTKSNKE